MMSSQPDPFLKAGLVSQNGCWQELDAAHLNKRIQESGLVLVEFWAPDCIFSRLVMPVRDKVEKRYSNHIDMLRCQISWEDGHLDTAWGISALPAVVLFSKGKRKARWISVTDPTLITEQIDAVISRLEGEQP